KPIRSVSLMRMTVIEFRKSISICLSKGLARRSDSFRMLEPGVSDSPIRAAQHGKSRDIAVQPKRAFVGFELGGIPGTEGQQAKILIVRRERLQAVEQRGEVGDRDRFEFVFAIRTRLARDSQGRHFLSLGEAFEGVNGNVVAPERTFDRW